MQLVPFRPFSRELSTFEKEMENLWKRFFGETSLAKPFTEEWAPTVDISETEDNYIVNQKQKEDIGMNLKEDEIRVPLPWMGKQ